MKKYAMHLLLIFSLAINLAAAGTLAYHHYRESRHGGGLSCGHKPFGSFMREDLQLNEGEISRFRSLFSQDKKSISQIKAQIRQQRRILFDMLGNPKVDEQQIDQQIEKIALLEARVQKIVLKRIITMRSNLSAEKQKRLLKIIRQKSGPFGRGPLGRGKGFFEKRGRR